MIERRGYALTADEQKSMRMRNLRTALIIASIAVAGFIGVIVRSYMTMK